MMLSPQPCFTDVHSNAGLIDSVENPFFALFSFFGMAQVGLDYSSIVIGSLEDGN